MKFRIKQKGDLEYSRYFPQRNGWKTMWCWECFLVPYYEIPHHIKYSKKYNISLSEDYTELFYNTKKEAEVYIEKYKAIHFEKIYYQKETQKIRKNHNSNQI